MSKQGQDSPDVYDNNQNNQNDQAVTLHAIKELIREFVEEREWQQYHNPKSLSMQIAIEAAELMEIFNWVEGQEAYEELERKRTEVEHEVADIAFTLFNFCLRNNIDLSRAIQQKMILNAQKYPVEKAKGKRAKYTEY